MMRINLLPEQALLDYKSNSKKIRVVTENWAKLNSYCPQCGNGLANYPNNKPVADLFCSVCLEDYELKSKKECLGSKIVDGAYRTMIERLQSGNNPNLFLLDYDIKKFEVINFLVIPKYFFVPEIIEKRPPLSSTARRAGWVGCNIVIKNIPRSGKIFLVENYSVRSKATVLDDWQKTSFLKQTTELKSKSWLLDIMSCIEKLKSKKFVLAEIYAFEQALRQKHPSNRHIKDKIRQHLQVLRDKGYLNFSGKGNYYVA